MPVANEPMTVLPPPAAPPAVGLHVSALRPDAQPGWLNGIRFVPEANIGTPALEGGAWWVSCGDDSDMPDIAPTAAMLDAVDYVPWSIIEYPPPCAIDGFVRTDYTGRARRALTAAQPRKMERELWLGEVAQAGGLPNDYLANPATAVDLGAHGLVYALAELQMYLASTIAGPGFIHCTPRVFTMWLSAQVVFLNGNLVTDGMGNIVVPGTGYPGTGPTGWDAAIPGLAEYAYATGRVALLEDTISVAPEAFEEAFDRRRNRVEYHADRTVATFHDQQAHGAVLVDLANPCSATGS